MRRLVLSLLSVISLSAALDQDGLSGVGHIFSAVSAGNMRLGVDLGSLMANDESILGGSSLTRDGQTYSINSYFTATSHAALSLGLGAYTEISLGLPLYYEYVGGGNLSINEHLPGDLQYRLKVELPIPNQKVFHLAAILGGSAPTAADGGTLPRQLELYTNDPAQFNQGSTPFGLGRPGFLGALGVTFDFGAIDPGLELRWHLNGGVRTPNPVGDPPFENVFFGGTALEWGVSTYLLLSAELYNESRFNQINSATWFDTEPTLLTLMATARLPENFQVQAGAQIAVDNLKSIPVDYANPQGPGYDQFSMSAAPQVGIYVGVQWSGFLLSQDRDHDGIPNALDKCPDDAEDKDGFQDEDGCPDPDNDHDGICDPWVAEKGLSAKYASVCHGSDKCPNDPEDIDGFQDEDGCPDLDNDHDGVPDIKDKCPNVAQGPNGVDGCPVLDADGDGIPDDKDKCPHEAEDKDGFQDEDGCPDPDNDHDGICDPWVAAQGLSAKYASVCHGSDKCPDAPETRNGFEDEDGCPDTVKQTQIVKTMVLKGVNFRSGSAELTPESYQVLDGVAAQLQLSPETRFEVAGHTDNRGNPLKNQALSRARAQTVANYLILKGVDAKRLRVMGYGSSKPIATNNTAEGRAMNRRVELNRIE